MTWLLSTQFLIEMHCILSSLYSISRSLIAYLDDVPDESVPHIHIPNSVPLVYKIDPHTGKAVDAHSPASSNSKGNWLLSEENKDRLVEKLGIDSESFARSLFSAWDVDGDGYLSREELGEALFNWKKDSNPAINALAGKMLEEVRISRIRNIIQTNTYCSSGHSNISTTHHYPFIFCVPLF